MAGQGRPHHARERRRHAPADSRPAAASAPIMMRRWRASTSRPGRRKRGVRADDAVNSLEGARNLVEPAAVSSARPRTKVSQAATFCVGRAAGCRRLPGAARRRRIARDGWPGGSRRRSGCSPPKVSDRRPPASDRTTRYLAADPQRAALATQAGLDEVRHVQLAADLRHALGVPR